MVKTAANLVVKEPATIIVSAYGVAEGSGVDLGSTEGGIKITSAPEWFWKKADQWLGKLGGYKVSEDITAEVLLTEPTQANLTYAFGYPTTAASAGTFDFGGNSTVTERTVYINGNGPDSSSRKITLHKVVFVGNPEYAMLKNGQTGLKLTMQLLQDTSKTANKQYFSIVDSGGDTTPPTVAMSSPIEDGTVVAGAKTVVQLTFTEATSRMDEGTLVYGDEDKATIFINNIETPLNTSLIAGTISYNAGTKVLTFTPTDNWAIAGNNYQIMVTTGVRDTAGNYLANTFYGHFVSV